MRVRGINLAIITLTLVAGTITSVRAKSAFSNHDRTGQALGASGTDTIKPQHKTTDKPELNPGKLSKIDSIVKSGIKAKIFPGCQVLILKDGEPVYDKCFGNYTYDAGPKVTPTTMYDLASLTKTTGTLLAVMKLYDQGKIRLTDKASKFLSFLKGTDKENITIKELLFHESGLPSYLPLYRLTIEKIVAPEKAVSGKTTRVAVENRIAGTNLHFKPGWVSTSSSSEYQTKVSDSLYLSTRFHDAAMARIAGARLYSKIYRYSCLNFILLKEVVETAGGTPMDVLLDREFYVPMKLKTMAYLPLRIHKKEQIAPTLKMDALRKEEIQGYVNDIDAGFLGGVSGNAGLFSSAHDVAVIYQMLLNDGVIDGTRYLNAETCKVFTTVVSPDGRRGLGFDKPFPANPKHNPCSMLAPKAVYGHTGYTGTCCWADPVNNLVYVFLSNRTFPYDGVNKLAKSNIRTKIQDIIYQSFVKK